MKRRIIYVSGTRADFGLLEHTLKQALADSRLDLQICVTGMHLLSQFGNTVSEIEAAGIPIIGRVPVDLEDADGAMMARALGAALIGITDVFARERPDMVMVLGDRGEMLAAALAALHLNIPVAHLHGGERSGTVDEPVRHAISKLSHYHFVATAGAQERLVKMGEAAHNIFVTGAPGLDGLGQLVTQSRAELCAAYQFDSDRPIAIVLFHPVVQEAAEAGEQSATLLQAVQAEGMQALCMMPNADAGNRYIRERMQRASADADIRLVTHLPRSTFVSWLAAVDLLVGNSSSGIIEAASLGLPVVNVGSRQNARERSANVIDCCPEVDAIRHAIRQANALQSKKFINVYGNGKAGETIVELLATLPLNASLLNKMNTY